MPRRSPERTAWENIKQRCYNPHNPVFRHYGGRGIVICDQWRDSFKVFFADVGPRPSARHSIDRFPDNNGNYEPGNVRWATQKDQLRNSRKAKLTSVGVLEIRRRRAAGELLATIAAAVGVSDTLVGDVLCGRRWADIQEAV